MLTGETVAMIANHMQVIVFYLVDALLLGKAIDKVQ